MIDTATAVCFEPEQLVAKINEAESQPPLLREFQVIPGITHLHTWHILHNKPFFADWITGFRAICVDGWDRQRSAALTRSSIIRFHVIIALTLHKVHSSYFILSFEERLYGTSNDSTGRKLERVNASVLCLLSETNCNWRATLNGRYAENLAHYALKRNQVYTNANPVN
jgi:hypothetical protein